MRRLLRYRRRVAKFPIRLPPGPKTEAEDLFEQLKDTLEKPSAREHNQNSWISAATWRLIDRRAQLKSMGSITQTNGRRWSREINASLK